MAPPSDLNIVLYQPDIPQNTAAFVRLCACLDLSLHIIEPCGFVWDEKKLKSVAMDYLEKASIIRHASFDAFLGTVSGTLHLLTTKASTNYTKVEYKPGDALMLGRESGGVPDCVHEAVASRITIPMQTGARSLNVVNAASMVAGEALRQMRWKVDER